MAQRFKITQTQRLDGGKYDNEVIGTSIFYETFPYDNDLMKPEEWTEEHGTFVEQGDNILIFERAQSEYDRTAEEWFDTYVETTVEKVEG